MKKFSLFFSLVAITLISLVGCGGNETAGEAESTATAEGVVDLYVEALNNEDLDKLLKTIHPFSGQHIELRGYYDNDFKQYDYEVEKVSATVSEESDTVTVIELVITKKLVEKKADGKNEPTEGEITQKLSLKTKGEEWLIDKVE
ncbi:hypothetical protein [Bacillus suaedaesalsae]|uniref:DUF4878 domain-containing protein n=1 Tax=Bacillus suaedaesalsae TaxID=2810349 RepID=A0ABS2DGE0_9BACI|nr:hypothetical protein [Bacillus suaedaesalsae]MBM6617559.1 hypothetical protein [Bacillus suaedaesalsae]